MNKKNMENLESSLKFEIQENNLPPNIILEQIKNQSNYGINNIITKNIRFNKNPINKIDYGKDDMKNENYMKNFLVATIFYFSCFFKNFW